MYVEYQFFIRPIFAGTVYKLHLLKVPKIKVSKGPIFI